MHYAVRSKEEAAFVEMLPASKTTTYQKSQHQRLSVKDLIPEPREGLVFLTRIFCCGPSSLLRACKDRTEELGYPEYMVQIEDFGGSNTLGSELGASFEVEVDQPETGLERNLIVPPDKALLQVLNDAGFDVMSSCNSGGCEACNTVCDGEVAYRSTALRAKEKGMAMQSCVDRGIGRLRIRVE